MAEKPAWLANLSEQAHQELTEDLGEVVLDRVAARFEATLSGRKARKFNAGWRAADAKSLQALERFISDHPEVVEEEGKRIMTQAADTHADVMKRLGY